MTFTDKIKSFNSNLSFLIFIFSFAILFGPAMTIMDSFDYANLSTDIKTYIGLANGDFDQSAVRRYRIIVPFLASVINFCFGFVFNKIQPWSFSGPDFSLGLSFLIINSAILSVASVYLFKILRLYNLKMMSCVLAILCFLTCRWSGYMAGLPWVDSLYFLMVVLLFYALLTSNETMVFISLLIGPLSKESFIFFYPLILLYGNVALIKKIIYMLLGIVLALTVRFIIDQTHHFMPTESLNADIDHIHQISASLKRIFSLHGLYELFSITGIFSIFILKLYYTKTRASVKKNLPAFSWLFCISVAIHALLSSDLTRMYFLLFPLICIALATIADDVIMQLTPDHEKKDCPQPHDQGQ